MPGLQVSDCNLTLTERIASTPMGSLFIDRQHHGVGWRINIEPDDLVQFCGELRIVGQLELARPMRLQAMLAPNAGTELTLIPVALAIAPAVQCVVSPGGSLSVQATTCCSTAVPSGGMRDGRVLSRSRPATPSVMNRSCQRQTAVLLVSVRRMISAVPQPSAVSRTICARQTCFCGLFRSATIAASCRRSAALNSTVIPAPMRQTRIRAQQWESQIGLNRQNLSTRSTGANAVHLSGGGVAEWLKAAVC